MNFRTRPTLFTLAFSALRLTAQTVLAAPCSTVPMRVEGGSMSPRIAPGQMIEVMRGPAECLGTIKRGDVVLFHSDSSRIPRGS